MEYTPGGYPPREHFAFELTYKTFPEVLYMVSQIDAYFYGYDTFDPKIDANYLKNSGVKFDSLFCMSLCM